MGLIIRQSTFLRQHGTDRCNSLSLLVRSISINYGGRRKVIYIDILCRNEWRVELHIYSIKLTIIFKCKKSQLFKNKLPIACLSMSTGILEI